MWCGVVWGSWRVCIFHNQKMHFYLIIYLIYFLSCCQVKPLNVFFFNFCHSQSLEQYTKVVQILYLLLNNIF